MAEEKLELEDSKQEAKYLVPQAHHRLQKKKTKKRGRKVSGRRRSLFADTTLDQGEILFPSRRRRRRSLFELYTRLIKEGEKGSIHLKTLMDRGLFVIASAEEIIISWNDP